MHLAKSVANRTASKKVHLSQSLINNTNIQPQKLTVNRHKTLQFQLKPNTVRLVLVFTVGLLHSNVFLLLFCSPCDNKVLCHKIPADSKNVNRRHFHTLIVICCNICTAPTKTLTAPGLHNSSLFLPVRSGVWCVWF